MKKSSIVRPSDTHSDLAKPRSHRQPPHLLRRPIQPHVLRPQLMHLRIQMLPQHCAKPIHDFPQLRKPQFSLPSPALRKIRLELIQPVMNLLVLGEEFKLFPESRHFLREDGEDVLLFDRVVDGEVVRKLVARLQEAAQGHALGFLARGAGVVQEVPGLAEVVVLKGKKLVLAARFLGPGTTWGTIMTYKHIHVLRHPVVYSELRRAQFRQCLHFLFLLFFGLFYLLLLIRSRRCCRLALLVQPVGFHFAESVLRAHVVREPRWRWE
jgi:hypothetical protein